MRTQTSATWEPCPCEDRVGRGRIGNRGVAWHGGTSFRRQAQTAAYAVGFVRRDSQENHQDLNLVDVVAGGDGFGTACDRGIDPATGKTTATQLDVGNCAACWVTAVTIGSNGRRLSTACLFRAAAEGPVQLDSAGHTFTASPAPIISWGYIWAGGVIPQYSVKGKNQGSSRRVAGPRLLCVLALGAGHARQQGNHLRSGCHSPGESRIQDIAVLGRGRQSAAARA